MHTDVVNMSIFSVLVVCACVRVCVYDGSQRSFQVAVRVVPCGQQTHMICPQLRGRSIEKNLFSKNIRLLEASNICGGFQLFDSIVFCVILHILDL
jgi:hypothetical protein